MLPYLDADAVRAGLPDVPTALALAERTMRALAGGRAQLPPKLGLTPRGPGAFAHAMPAWLEGDAADGVEDLLGIKWIVGVPENSRRGLPTLQALVIVNDGATGRPRAVLDGGPITACRTAAVSGLAIRRFHPSGAGSAGSRVAFLGAGVQGRSHLPVVAHLLTGARLAIFDRHRERAEALAAEATRTAGIAEARAAASAREALDGAAVVVSMVSFGPAEARQALDPAWFVPDALVVAVDYDTNVPARLARDARRFVTDDRGQFRAAQAAGWFADYPEPAATLGELLLTAEREPGVGAAGTGRILVAHLGVGLADLVFADAVIRAVLDGDGRGDRREEARAPTR